MKSVRQHQVKVINPCQFYKLFVPSNAHLKKSRHTNMILTRQPSNGHFEKFTQKNLTCVSFMFLMCRTGHFMKKLSKKFDPG